MLSRDVLKLATRVFRTNRLRTALTILGIGVGIGAIVFLVSLGFGVQRLLLSRITSSDALLSLSATTNDPESIPLNKKFLETAAAIENVSEVYPVASFSAQIILNSLGTNIAAKAVAPPFFRLADTKVQEGTLFKEGEKDKIVLSTATLQALNITDPKTIIGKKVTVDIFPEETAGKRTREFIVCGVIKDDLATFAYIPSSQVEDFEVKSFEEVKVKVKESEYLDPVREEIIKQGFMVVSLSDTIKEANQVFKTIQFVLGLFGMIALLVASIGMFNTMTIALLERTREIGIMKALGAADQDIMKTFLAESMLIGSLGGTAGVVIGLLGGAVVNTGVNALATRLGGQSVSLFYFPPAFIVLIITFSALVGFLTGLYPAKHASDLNPLDALRYK